MGSKKKWNYSMIKLKQLCKREKMKNNVKEYMEAYLHYQQKR